MVCLIKSENKPLLDSYADILGSEDAAYYVLSKNNGYSLEFTPSGERSDLFRQLLAKNNYDYKEAIREKAEMYYSSFYNEIGGDWTITSLDSSVVDQNGEPKIDYTPEEIDFAGILSPEVKFNQTDHMSLSEIDYNLFQDDMYKSLGDISNDTSEQIHSKKLKWLKDKQKKLVDSINQQILSAFGLEKKVDSEGNIYFVSKEKDELGRHKVMIQFCEYIENGKAGVYDQTGRLEAAANLIQISLTDADPTTFNHELAHHYVRMFWNSDLIQAVAKKLDTGDRSEGWKVRLEEKIVDEITSRTTDVSGFWNKLGDIIKSAFRWLSSPVKQSLLRKASIAFRLNDQSLSLRREQYVLSFIDPYARRVFQNAPNPLSQEFDRILHQFGIKEATKLFITDSVSFFEKYHAQPDSILKDQYDEYMQHFKNALAGLNISDQEFNEAVILISDHERQTVRQFNNPTDIHRVCADILSSCINEIRTIRANIGAQPGFNITPSGQNNNQQTVNNKLSDLMEQIALSIKTRVYEYLHTVPKEAQKSNEAQQLFERLSLIADNLDKLKTFISSSTEELKELYNKLEEFQRSGFKDVTTQQLMSIRNTIDGFYDPIIKLIYKTISQDNNILYDLGVKLSNISQLCNVISGKLTHANTVLSERTTHEFMFGTSEDPESGVMTDLLSDYKDTKDPETGQLVSEKDRWLNNFDDQLIIGKLFEDINMVQPYVGLSSRSRSLVVRVARNMILNANADIRHATLKDIGHIIKLYAQALPEMRKLGLKELQSVFQEMDEKGIPTGYFVRRLNHGKFYRQFDEEKDRLVNIANEKLKAAFGDNAPKIEYDYFNNPILPPDDNPTVKQILTEYADNLDEWLCKHSDRMFTPEYYRMRRLKLSPNTRQVMSNLQSRINQLMSKCPIVTIKDASGNDIKLQATWELSPEDQQNLIQLRTEYQQLGNQYYSDGTKKQGEELKIALEISDFNKWKGEKVRYNQNDLRFNAVVEEIRKKYGQNSIEESRFRKLNTTLVVNPDYYEYVMSKISLSSNIELDKLRQKRNDLRKLIEDFDKKGIDIEQKRRQILYWDQLKDVDRQITELLKRMSSDPDGETWSDYFDKEMVMYDSDTTLLDHMLKQDTLEYRRLHPADTRTDEELRTELIQKYQYTYTWYDKGGQPHESVALVSVFTRYVPKGASFKNNVTTATFKKNGRTKIFPNAIITRYSQQFSDIDPESEFYNKNYDRTNPAFVQPKKDEYQNDLQWKMIEDNKNILALYNALIELMQKNYQKLPNTNADNYRLPQLTGRRLTILRRSGSLKELCDAVIYNWKNEWQLNDRDDSDVNYEDQKIKIRADGTRINTVPTRWLKPLDEKRALTSDVIGSIIAFTEMANNFVIKTQLASDLEVIKHQLMDREDYGIAERRNQKSTKNIVKQLTNMMDDQLYGNTTKLGNKTSNFSKNQQRLIKFMGHIQHLGRKLMLGYNFTSMHVGFWESAIRGFLEALLGKDYTMRDFLHAWGKMRKYGPNTIRNVGGFKVTNLMIAQMQWFGVSKSIRESYHSTERNRFIKLLSENIDGMFGFTLGDYSNSAFQLSMALSNIRFIECDENIKTGFYSKFTLIKAYQKAGMTFSDAKRIALIRYNQSGITLEDAYELNEDGYLQPKQQYAQYVNKKIENRVTGKCYQRLAEALGVVPTTDNPGYGLQVLSRPGGVLRNFIFTVMARNWNYAHDLQKRYVDQNGKIVKINDMMDGYIDIDAGNANIGLHQGLYEWMKMIAPKLPLIGRIFHSTELNEQSREIYNYAGTKVLLEILTIVSLVGISTLFKAMARGADDDDWWWKFGYLTSVRLVNSFISVLDPTSLLEIIKNISTLISPLNDIINSIMILSDALGLSGHSPFEEIKSGSYKGHSRLFRNLMRITPLGNAYEDLSSSALKSRTNWYLQQDPLIWSSIGGVFDQLWGTDSEGIKTKKK